MKFYEIEIKVDGKVIKTINNIEICKRTELELADGNIDLYSLADLQEKVWSELTYDKLLDTSISHFFECDNVDEIIEFVDKWVCLVFITYLTNYCYKKYKVKSLNA